MKIKIRHVCLMLTSVLWTGSAFGIIIHDGAAAPSDTPNDAVVGSWGGNSSVVAISANYAITTVHQNGARNSTSAQTMNNVVFGGTTYYPTFVAWGGSTGGTADIRIVQLWSDAGHTTAANLANYAGLFNTTDEAGQNVTLGGHGRTRGADLTKDDGGGDITYGYDWGGNNDNTNGTNWATNIIDSTGTAGSDGDTIIADFDGMGAGDSTASEGIIANYDSGGGMFYEYNSEWYVMGLNYGVEHSNEAWFRNDGFPDTADPDTFNGIRVSSYADWITSNVSESISTVPEPTSLLLISTGGFLLLSRRIRRRKKHLQEKCNANV